VRWRLALVLLFTVGLETDIGLLLRYSVAGVLVGLGAVAAGQLDLAAEHLGLPAPGLSGARAEAGRGPGQ